MYHRGTLSDYNAWHDPVKILEGITAEGKINSNKGKPAPNKQRTTAYSNATAHPSNADDYIWDHNSHPDGALTVYSKAEVEALGWFPEE